MNARISALAVALCLPACSLGGGGAPGTSPPAPVTTSSPAATSPLAANAAVSVHVSTPYAAHASARRRPAFVSPSSGGLEIQLFTPGNDGGTAVSTVVADISGANGTPAASQCSNDTSDPGRTCTVGISAPVGTYDFVVTTYSGPPANGSFAGASKLGSGTVPSQQLMTGSVATINVTVNGTIATLALTLPPSSEPYAALTANVGVVALDAANNVIIGTYESSVSVAASTTTTGSAVPTLSLNGGSATTNAVTTTQSSDTISLALPAQPASDAGNVITVTATGAAGVTATKRLMPLYLTASSESATFGAVAPPTLHFLSSSGTATVSIREGTFAGTYTLALDSGSPSGCAGSSSPFALSAETLQVTSGGTGQFTLSATGTSGAASCTYDVSDGTTTIPLVATPPDTGSGSTMTMVPSNLLYFTSFASQANGPANAPGDALPADYTAVSQPEISVLRLSDGQLFTISDPNVRQPMGIAHDANGDVFVADAQMKAVYEYTPSQLVAVGGPSSTAAVTYTSGLSVPSGLAVVQSTGRMFVSDYKNGTISVFDTTTTGHALVSTMNVNVKPAGVAIDASGNVFVAYPNAGSVLEYAPPAAGTSTPASIGSVGSGTFKNPVAVVVAANGTIDVMDSQLSLGAPGIPTIYTFAPSNLSTATASYQPGNTAKDDGHYQTQEASLAVDGSETIYSGGYNVPADVLEYIVFPNGTTTQISDAAYPNTVQVYIPYMDF